jgi:hypothetical protein
MGSVAVISSQMLLGREGGLSEDDVVRHGRREGDHRDQFAFQWHFGDGGRVSWVTPADQD